MGRSSRRYRWRWLQGSTRLVWRLRLARVEMGAKSLEGLLTDWAMPQRTPEYAYILCDTVMANEVSVLTRLASGDILGVTAVITGS